MLLCTQKDTTNIRFKLCFSHSLSLLLLVKAAEVSFKTSSTARLEVMNFLYFLFFGTADFRGRACYPVSINIIYYIYMQQHREYRSNISRKNKQAFRFLLQHFSTTAVWKTWVKLSAVIQTSTNHWLMVPLHPHSGSPAKNRSGSHPGMLQTCTCWKAHQRMILLLGNFEPASAEQHPALHDIHCTILSTSCQQVGSLDHTLRCLWVCFGTKLDRAAIITAVQVIYWYYHFGSLFRHVFLWWCIFIRILSSASYSITSQPPVLNHSHLSFFKHSVSMTPQTMPLFTPAFKHLQTLTAREVGRKRGRLRPWCFRVWN